MRGETLAIAKAAYATYKISMGNKSAQGIPLLEFDELTKQEQLAWIGASSAAIRTAAQC